MSLGLRLRPKDFEQAAKGIGHALIAIQLLDGGLALLIEPALQASSSRVKSETLPDDGQLGGGAGVLSPKSLTCMSMRSRKLRMREVRWSQSSSSRVPLVLAERMAVKEGGRRCQP